MENYKKLLLINLLFCFIWSCSQNSDVDFFTNSLDESLSNKASPLILKTVLLSDFQQILIDLNEVLPNENIIVDIQVINDTDEPFVPTDINKNCGCLSIDIPDKIMPNQRGTIRIQVIPYQGYFEAIVYFHMYQNLHRKFNIKILGYTKYSTHLSYEEIFLGTIDDVEIVECRNILYVPYKSKFQLLNVETDDPLGVVDTNILHETDQEIIYELIYYGSPISDRLNHRITVQVSWLEDGKYQNGLYTISYHTKLAIVDYSYVPDVISFGYLTEVTKISQKVVLGFNDGTPIFVEMVGFDRNKDAFEAIMENNNTPSPEIHVTPSFIQGVQFSNLLILVNSPRKQLISVPCRYIGLNSDVW